MSTAAPPIFIVGNSRSGTTMLMRILDGHPRLHTLNEPHFFERYWQANGRPLPREEAAALLTQMVSNQRDGFFATSNPRYYKECQGILAQSAATEYTPSFLYQLFLRHETEQGGYSVSCDKTPQNVFYIQEILSLFPDARIINMVRDPRSVLASQKNKWRRKELGSSFMPAKEVRRLRINYHPLTMCQLWNAAVGAACAFKGHPQVRSVRYEDLLNDPEKTVEALCAFCALDFHVEMLHIPVANSSVRADVPGEKGIEKASRDAWKQHLEGYEIAMVQRFCKAQMAAWQYEPVLLEISGIQYALSLLSYPFKVVLALVVNVSRIKNLKDTIVRRVSHFSSSKRYL